MSILDILKLAGTAGAGLVALLEKVKAELPDLAPEVDAWLAAIAKAVDAPNLVALAEALPKELANIGQGHLDPRRHPSDVA